MPFDHVVPLWLTKVRICGVQEGRFGSPTSAGSMDYAAIRSVSIARLRIITRSALSALCGASHNAEFEAAMIRERTRAGLARLGRRESVLAAAN
jgi:hypothetical protein